MASFFISTVVLLILLTCNCLKSGVYGNQQLRSRDLYIRIALSLYKLQSIYKYVMFGDTEMAKKIMKADKPMAMKAFGRKVSNFDKKIWNENCQDIVKRGNIAKFSQNKDLKAKLFATGDTIMAEASPRDIIWGIGLGATNPKAQRKETWRGKNWLGYILTDVRNELKALDNSAARDDSSESE